MALTQDGRLLAIDTPLGPNVLVLQQLTGTEDISRPFAFTLDLLSETPSIALESMLGQRVTIRIARTGGGRPRVINGLVNRFALGRREGSLTHYEAEIVPWLWFLTLPTNCRIFQDLTAPEVIARVFQDHGFTDVRLALEGSFERRACCVQYRETDLAFVSRLVEEEGIFYFFEHDLSRHTLVLGNAPGAHPVCPGQPRAMFDSTSEADGQGDVITAWLVAHEIRSGQYALADFNFETPSTSLTVGVASAASGPGARFELYDYPGDYLTRGQGERLAKLRLESEETPGQLATGASTCRAFSPGFRFELQGHYRPDLDRSYVLLGVRHSASAGSSYLTGSGPSPERYANQLTGLPLAIPFRPRRTTPRPIVPGPQTAIVVGRSRDEIHSDRYGRVKVQFHWDRSGRRNESSSGWIRVSHALAGKGWGMVAIPRVGQEVIVEFLEGDPDRPIVTGRVYNAEQMPPYPLPQHQATSVLQTRSTPGGSSGTFNEIRFEDTKGSELLSIHAERNLEIVVENDKLEQVANRETTTIGSERRETIGGGHRITVGLAQEAEVGADQATTIGRNRRVSVAGTDTVQVGGARATTIGGTDSLSAGQSLTITVADQILITTGQASILMKRDGTITIEGSTIALRASGDIILKGSKIVQN